MRIGIVAGEKSGDILGAGLIAALQAHYPDAEFIGVGGPGMEALGCHSITPMERLSVMGFVEPLGRLPELLQLKRNLEQLYRQSPPDLFIGIDSPDFNLRLEAALKQQGVPTVHYVSPSVWAYRQGRIHKIKQAVDLMLTLFPFETDIYAEHGVDATCVGHPLADQIGFEDRKPQSRTQLGLDDDEPVVALLPGSRSSEINRLAPLFLSAALETLQQVPRLRFLVPFSGMEARACIDEQLQALSILGHDQFMLVEDSQLAMSAADFVVLASGTATLEAMLLRRPMIVCYKLAPLTYFFASRMVKVPHIALPNLLSGKSLVPEYVQHEIEIPVLRDEIVKFFTRADSVQGLLAEFDQLHRALRKDASAAAANAVVKLLQSRQK